MQQAIQCPSCDKQHNFDEKHLGKIASCKCGAKFKLATPETPKNSQAEEFQEIILKPNKLSYLLTSLGLVI